MDLDDEPDLSLDPREHICPDCRLVHWTPTGPAFCGISD